MGPETIKSVKNGMSLNLAFVKFIVDCYLSEILLELCNGNFEWTAQLGKRVLDRISHFVLFVAAEMLIITFKSHSEQ